MAKKKSNDDYKDIFVYFSDSDDDMELRKKIAKRCKYMSPGAFLKEAAEEKLGNEEKYKRFLENLFSTKFEDVEILSSVQQQNTNELTSDIKESMIDDIMNAFDDD